MLADWYISCFVLVLYNSSFYSTLATVLTDKKLQQKHWKYKWRACEHVLVHQHMSADCCSGTTRQFADTPKLTWLVAFVLSQKFSPCSVLLSFSFSYVSPLPYLLVFSLLLFLCSTFLYKIEVFEHVHMSIRINWTHFMQQILGIW